MLEDLRAAAAATANRLPDQCARLRIDDINRVALGVIGADRSARILVEVVSAGKHDYRCRTVGRFYKADARV